MLKKTHLPALNQVLSQSINYFLLATIIAIWSQYDMSTLGLHNNVMLKYLSCLLISWVTEYLCMQVNG